MRPYARQSTQDCILPKLSGIAENVEVIVANVEHGQPHAELSSRPGDRRLAALKTSAR